MHIFNRKRRSSFTLEIKFNAVTMLIANFKRFVTLVDLLESPYVTEKVNQSFVLLIKYIQIRQKNLQVRFSFVTNGSVLVHGKQF